jgi:hypothetical protein
MTSGRRDNAKIYWELGRLGVSWEIAQKLFLAAMDAHQGWSVGAADIPGTDRQLVYEPGIDGWDSWYRIRDKPA